MRRDVNDDSTACVVAPQSSDSFIMVNTEWTLFAFFWLITAPSPPISLCMPSATTQTVFGPRTYNSVEVHRDTVETPAGYLLQSLLQHADITLHTLAILIVVHH